MKGGNEPFKIKHNREVRGLNIVRIVQGDMLYNAVESHQESCKLIVLDWHNRMLIFSVAGFNHKLVWMLSRQFGE